MSCKRGLDTQQKRPTYTAKEATYTAKEATYTAKEATYTRPCGVTGSVNTLCNKRTHSVLREYTLY